MDLWKDITKFVSDTANATVDGARKIGDAASLQFDISTKKNEIRGLYETVGKLSYDEQANNRDYTEEKTRLCESISVMKAELAQMEKKLSELKKQRRCVNCNEKLGKNAAFCSKCGTRQSEK